ncbi:MAG: hypothetical protein LBV71_00850 [Prevotella sp.]|nr:hypothetical protein [Prevotella sp.]
MRKKETLKMTIYDSLMFCLKDDILKEFLTKAEITVLRSDEKIKTTVNPMSNCLISFAHSLPLNHISIIWS